MTFSREEFHDRGRRALDLLGQHGLDALVISLREHLTYLTGLIFYDLDAPIMGVIDRDGQLTVFGDDELGRLLDEQRDGLAADVVWRPSAGDRLESLCAEACEQSSAGHVGYEGDWYALSRSARDRLRSSAPAIDWHEATALLAGLRLVKSDEEIAVMRQAAAYADEGMTALVELVREGVREVDLFATAQRCITELGSEYSSFPGLVGAGERSGLYHPLPTTRRLQHGEAVELEVTGAKARYNSNLVRTVFVGAANAEQRMLYDVVSEAFHAGVQAVRPGEPVGSVDRVTRDIRRDYAKYIPSRAGYGLELSYPPFLTGGMSILEGDPHVFEPGMVFSLEPAIAGYERQTIILGCNVLVSQDGAEILHQFPRALRECG